VQSAWTASRNKKGYLYAQFLRVKSRPGPKKAIMAVAASILTAAYHLVRDPVPYRELGPVYLLRLDHERTAARLMPNICEISAIKSKSEKPQPNPYTEVSW
jgi:hypothetical protein